MGWEFSTSDLLVEDPCLNKLELNLARRRRMMELKHIDSFNIRAPPFTELEAQTYIAHKSVVESKSSIFKQ